MINVQNKSNEYNISVAVVKKKYVFKTTKTCSATFLLNQ